jgi:hypothetical protein
MHTIRHRLDAAGSPRSRSRLSAIIPRQRPKSGWRSDTIRMGWANSIDESQARQVSSRECLTRASKRDHPKHVCNTWIQICPLQVHRFDQWISGAPPKYTSCRLTTTALTLFRSDRFVATKRWPQPGGQNVHGGQLRAAPRTYRERAVAFESLYLPTRVVD